MLQNSGTGTEQAISSICLICRWLENLEYLNLVITGILVAHWAVIPVFHSHASLHDPETHCVVIGKIFQDLVRPVNKDPWRSFKDL